MIRPLISLVLLCSVATLCGCHTHPDMQRCVDVRNLVVADAWCQQVATSVKPMGSINSVRQYRSYYGGGGGFAIGTKAFGGTDRPLSGHIYETSSMADQGAHPRAIGDQPYVSVPAR